LTQIAVGTTQGPARLDWTTPAGTAPGPLPFVMALTHGAGGTTHAPDLLAARDAAVQLGGGVALISQPYRVRGARAPGSAERQDEAWIEIITWLLTTGPPAPSPHQPPAALIVGGRSNGARVACRTAAAVGARGVLALAFPLQPPARRRRGSEAVIMPPDRSPELRAAAAGGAHVLVLNGDRDSFGIPVAAASTQVVVLKGEAHSLSKKPAAVAEAVAAWLTGVALLVPREETGDLAR
jgi:predicted alpha/beta-hydrolase family hydrolase